MNNSRPSLVEPARAVVHASGLIDGRTRRYEKRLGDMAGVYADEAAYAQLLAREGPDRVVYRVDESRAGTGPGALIMGTSTLLPGRVGDEFAVTRGHLHRQASRAEVYYGLSGAGLLLLEDLDGDYRALEITPGVAVNVPGFWLHRSVNTGAEPLVTLFVYNEDSGQDYDIIAHSGGMVHLVVATADGWAVVPNPRHRGYQRGQDS